MSDIIQAVANLISKMGPDGAVFAAFAFVLLAILYSVVMKLLKIIERFGSRRRRRERIDDRS
jgi:hypothetical protein